MACEYESPEEARRAERIAAQSMIDPQTEMFNQQGWDLLLAEEEKRCALYGYPAVIVSVNLNVAQNDDRQQEQKQCNLLHQETAQILVNCLRKTDVIAQVGVGKFLALAIECKQHGAELISQRLRTAFEINRISASVGTCFSQPGDSMQTVCHQANEAMHEHKRHQAVFAGSNGENILLIK